MAFLQRKFAHPGLLPTLYSSFSEDIIYYLPLLGRLELTKDWWPKVSAPTAILVIHIRPVYRKEVGGGPGIIDCRIL